MKSLLRGVLAVVVGLLLGSVVNMGLIVVGGRVIPPPPGVDVSSAESIKASIHLFEPRHFAFPFLAHALGTLVGATLASWIGGSRGKRYAYGIGVIFLAGGIGAVMMIPGPVWFAVLDLVLAYLPMAWLGGVLGASLRRGAAPRPEGT